MFLFCHSALPVIESGCEERHVTGREGVKVMSKAEIALQLTLKAMEEHKVGLEGTREAYKDNARKVYEFYNEVYDNLREKLTKPIT